MKTCRVCGQQLDDEYQRFPGPSVTSIATIIEVDVVLYVCSKCGHVQSPAHSDIQEFYKNDYRLSLVTEDHDQVYSIINDEITYRCEKQATIIGDLCPPDCIDVLDFGAGKAMTLKNLSRTFKDIRPHVFDVSDDYRPFWASWLSREQQATHQLPELWHAKFDLIIANFVFEHIESPAQVLLELQKFLRPEGRIFLSVPNFETNSGDLLVVDHVNHFSESSLRALASEAGMAVDLIDIGSFDGAFCVVLKKTYLDISDSADLGDLSIDRSKSVILYWSRLLTRLNDEIIILNKERVAIFGAGFYGTLIASKLLQKLTCFYDSNPRISEGAKFHCGFPVFPPIEIDSTIDLLFIGLNPRISKQIIDSYSGMIPGGTRLVFLED
jgi:2-polyprenyl-3-methyl-5-hydroxy-6-metoxy-1,4-benzoquinol methylase